MKKSLIESNISNFIKDKLGVDLSDRIHMVTNQYELPMVFDRVISSKVLNQYLNRYGPMYVFEGKKNTYLGREHKKNEWFIVDERDSQVSEFDVMKDLGIEMLGLSLNDLVSEYINETTKKSMNYVITESQLERLSQEIDICCTQKNSNLPLSKTNPRMMGFPLHVTHTYIDKLIDMNYKNTIGKLFKYVKY